MEIPGKKVLITGAASGIGKATALAMAKRGARLFITDINSHGLEQTRREIAEAGGEVCLSMPLDISDYEAVRKLADEIHAGYGSLDILANVAGIALFSQVEDMTHDQWERIVNVNLWGPYHAIECFVPEKVAALIIRAIERNRYMVITSMDIKLLYFLKRTFPPLYDLVLRFMTWFLDRTLTRDSLSSIHR